MKTSPEIPIIDARLLTTPGGTAADTQIAAAAQDAGFLRLSHVELHRIQGREAKGLSRLWH